MPNDNKKQQLPQLPGDYKNITMYHGSGGRLTHQLIENIFIKTFDSTELKRGHDGAVFNNQNNRYAFTTDSFVIKPLFFPGGNIGSLSVIGTVNDLAMCGAKPLYLSVGLIIEEGFPIDTLKEIIHSMKIAADSAGVQIVTGDTKVVEYGKCDGIYINTSGVGSIDHQLDICPQSIKSGDAIIINRDIGRHGVAVLSIREGLQFDTKIESDCAPLADSIITLIENDIHIKCLRDLTRGGLASALTELAGSANLQFSIDEEKVPISIEVNNACDILGFDPLQVANEGTFILFVSGLDAERALKILKNKLNWKDASIIGQVNNSSMNMVTIKSKLGTERIITMPIGEQQPRIC